MSTFSELQEKLSIARNRRTVLMYLVDHIEEEFVAQTPEAKPKRLILTDDKVPVPQAAFDSVVEEMLKEVSELEDDINTILQSTLKSSKSGDSKNAPEA